MISDLNQVIGRRPGRAPLGAPMDRGHASSPPGCATAAQLEPDLMSTPASRPGRVPHVAGTAPPAPWMRRVVATIRLIALVSSPESMGWATLLGTTVVSTRTRARWRGAPRRTPTSSAAAVQASQRCCASRSEPRVLRLCTDLAAAFGGSGKGAGRAWGGVHVRHLRGGGSVRMSAVERFATSA
jgi:hypothetical protein